MQIVVDIEHTLTNASHRMHYLVSGDHDKFQEEMINDSLNQNVKMFIDQWYKLGYTIVLLSAKSAQYQDIVIDWLDKHEINYDKLFMKTENVYGSDSEFKEEYVSDNHQDILFGLDDVGKNCAVFAKYKVPCLRVEQK